MRFLPPDSNRPEKDPWQKVRPARMLIGMPVADPDRGAEKGVRLHDNENSDG